MSIPRSKERVCVKTHDVDGTLLGERYATQNVYRPVGKTPYIIWAGGQRPLVSDAPPVAEYNVLARLVDCSWDAVEKALAAEAEKRETEWAEVKADPRMADFFAAINNPELMEGP